MKVFLSGHTVYIITVVLFLAGIVCYAGFPKNAPEEPARIMLENTGGTVFFDHKRHVSENHFGITCTGCHHTWNEGDGKPLSCTGCHKPDGEDLMKRHDALHLQCIGCHENAGKAPVKCAGCHISG
ncbi:MAG TPA: cytochrome C [Desulfobacteraceae bacterium]|nr:cytochrome C [Desulfobacteraceae bacterium]